MPLRFLFDEDSLDESLRTAIDQHNEANPNEAIERVYIGDSSEDSLPRRSNDPAVIRWAAERNLVIVSKDANTLIAHHTAFVIAGNSTPGLLILRRRFEIEAVIESLFLIPCALR